MKQKLLLLLMLLLPLAKAEVCIGQGLPSIYKTVINGMSDQIKYDPMTGNYILYSCPGSENHFSLTDIVNTTIDVKISVGYAIKDFEIFENYVFFCGSTATGEGLIGWFDIIDLFHGNQPAHFDETLINEGLNSLEDIEVYKDSYGIIHIAGYGITSALPEDISIGFEAMGDPLAGMQYRTAKFQYSVHDLTITDNLVVYAGCYGANSIILYPFLKNNIFPSSGTYNASYFGTTSSIFKEPNPNDIIEIVHIGGDDVATLSHRTKDSNFTIISQYLVLRTYQVSSTSAVMLSAYQMSYPYICLPSLRNIREAAFDPNLNTYYILNKFQTTTGTDIYAMTEFDFSTGIPSFAHNYYIPYPLIVMSGFCLTTSPYYTVCGFDQTYFETYYWQGIHSSPTGNCIDDEVLPFQKTNLIDAKDLDCWLDANGWLPLTFPYEVRHSETIKNSDLFCSQD